MKKMEKRGPEHIHARRRWRWGSCLTHCASLTLLTFMELAEDGEKLGGQPRRARIFHSTSKGLGQV